MADALAQVKKSTGTQFVYSLCDWGMVSLEIVFWAWAIVTVDAGYLLLESSLVVSSL